MKLLWTLVLGEKMVNVDERMSLGRPGCRYMSRSHRVNTLYHASED